MHVLVELADFWAMIALHFPQTNRSVFDSVQHETMVNIFHYLLERQVTPATGKWEGY